MSGNILLTLVLYWPFLLIYLLSLYQLWTILFTVNWCLHLLFFLIYKCMVSSFLQTFLLSSSSWFCPASSWNNIVLLKLIYEFLNNVWVFLLKAIRSVNVFFTSLLGHLFKLFVLFDWFIGLIPLYSQWKNQILGKGINSLKRRLYLWFLKQFLIFLFKNSKRKIMT